MCSCEAEAGSSSESAAPAFSRPPVIRNGAEPDASCPATIAVVGVNHRDTPISLRERLSIPPAELPRMLARFHELEGVEEAVALSTCNRAELYAVLRARGEDVLERTASAFCEARGVAFEKMETSLYRIEGLDAVRHLFEVACGLDSMVPGENEVFGQVKAAYLAAIDAGTAGPEMRRLFQRTFKVAKDVRSRTGISRRKVSIATVVADLARKVFGRLGEARVAMVGAGKMAELTLKTLVSGGAPVAVIANRSLESAERLASRYGGRAVTLDGMGAELPRADILVAAVSQTVISAEHVKKAALARRGRPMLLVDLGVPRNIEREAANFDGVILYDIDDLQEVVARNTAYRLEQADQARKLVADEVRKFAALLRADEVTDTVSKLRSELKLIGDDECRRTLRRLSGLRRDLTDEERREVSLMAQRIVGKILHSPISALKQEARRGNGAETERSIRRLFGL